MSDIHALVPASAEVRRDRVCSLTDPPPDPMCRGGLDHRVGTAVRRSHCGQLPQVVRLGLLVRRLVTRPAAGGADR